MDPRRKTRSFMEERSMHKRIALSSFTLVMLCLSTLARADANPLLGTWQLKSFVREVAGTGERYNQLGDHPDGYISYSPDGRMVVLFVSGDQPRPRNEPSDEERIKLITEVLDDAGIMPPPAREPLPEIEKHEVRLVAWMAVRGTAGVSQQ